MTQSEIQKFKRKLDNLLKPFHSAIYTALKSYLPEDEVKVRKEVDMVIIDGYMLYNLEGKILPKNYFKYYLLSRSSKYLNRHTFKNYGEWLTHLILSITRPSTISSIAPIDDETKVPILPHYAGHYLSSYIAFLPNDMIYTNISEKNNGYSLSLFNLYDKINNLAKQYNLSLYATISMMYEISMTSRERKSKDSFYISDYITKYINSNTIQPYIIDKCNISSFAPSNQPDPLIKAIESIDNPDVLTHIFNSLKEITILDPAVGTGNFIDSAINELLDIYFTLLRKGNSLSNKPSYIHKIVIEDNHNYSIKTIDFLELYSNDRARPFIKPLLLYYIIIPHNLYGVDIDEYAIYITRMKLLLHLAEAMKPYFEFSTNLSNGKPSIHLAKDLPKDIPIPLLYRIPDNMRIGDSLIGYTNLSEIKSHFQEEQEPSKQSNMKSLLSFNKSNQKSNIEITSNQVKIDGILSIDKSAYEVMIQYMRPEDYPDDYPYPSEKDLKEWQKIYINLKINDANILADLMSIITLLNIPDNRFTYRHIETLLQILPRFKRVLKHSQNATTLYTTLYILSEMARRKLNIILTAKFFETFFI